MGLEPPREPDPPQSQPAASNESIDIRKTVTYSGRVQGVGFRATTARVAGRFPIEGYVENRPDGTVRLIAEGDPEEVDLFLLSIRQRLAQQIEAADVCESIATGEFGRFFIKRSHFF